MKLILFLLLLSLSPALPAQEEKAGEKGARIEKRMRLANELESQGDSEGALKILKELSDADPENAGLLERVAILMIKTEQFKEAIPRLQKMLELKNGTANDYSALARMMIEVGESEAAITFLEDASKRFPESADFPFLLTYPLAKLDRWNDALAQFRKTVDLAKGESSDLLNEGFYFRYAAAHERAGDFAEAEKGFRKTLDLITVNDPNGENPEFTATVKNYLAYMWLERGENIDEAGTMAQEAAKLDPESGAIADTVGCYHMKKGNYPRALVELKKAERLIEKPDSVIFDHLGETLAKLNEKEFAAEYFRKALELDPKNEALKARLAAVGK